MAQATLQRTLADRTVLLAFAFLAVFWIPVDAGWLFEPLYAVLYPFWLPGYLSVLFASGLRNVYLPWLGSGVLFEAVGYAFLYLEAVLLAGVYRALRGVYRTYQRGKAETAA